MMPDLRLFTIGKKVRCSACKHEFVIPLDFFQPPQPPIPPPKSHHPGNNRGITYDLFVSYARADSAPGSGNPARRNWAEFSELNEPNSNNGDGQKIKVIGMVYFPQRTVAMA